MRASEIPVFHLCYHTDLNKYGIVCHPHEYNSQIGNVVIWLHNFCAITIEAIDKVYEDEDCYLDLGPAPKFDISHKVIQKTEIDFRVKQNT